MMKNKITFFIILLYTVLYNSTNAQPGANDPSFNPGTGADYYVLTTAIQNDGKILIGGGFILYNGISINRIARLNTDGSLDATFNPGTGANSLIYSISIQNDGKIIIGGFFSTYNGTTRNGIARLNNDGSLDGTFNPGSGVNGSIWTTAIPSDGKIIIGGDFHSYNGISINNIARLNSNGSLDVTFTPGAGANGIVATTAVQSDGRIFIGGYFYSYNGVSRKYIARLNSDGNLDMTFDPGTGANTTVYIISLQSDGKIIIGGEFSLFNDISMNRIARLNSDGSLDATFNPGTGANNYIHAISVQTDGKIIIGGNFTTFNGNSMNRIARLNAEGSIDPTFNPGNGANNWINSSVLQSDGNIIIGGFFSSYNSSSRIHIARILGGTVEIKENINKNNIIIYPNPTKGNVSLNFKGYNGDIKITISNSMGASLQTENIKVACDNFIKTIDMLKYPNGIYYIQIVNNEKAFMRKVVKL